MLGILVDANPDLITRSELREYASPHEAIDGLYERWTRAREPLLILFFGHPSERMRKLAFDLQVDVEMSLRETAKALEGEGKGWSNITPRDWYDKALKTASALSEQITGAGSRGE